MLHESATLSLRKLAQATGLPKSSVARHRKALVARDQWPEAPFWEQEAGYQWLRILVLAVIFVFGIKGGVDFERISEFFHRQLNHCARGTPARRLKVLTVIHNFDLQRADGTTAAERPH